MTFERSGYLVIICLQISSRITSALAQSGDDCEILSNSNYDEAFAYAIVLCIIKTFVLLAEEATESKGATLLNLSDFRLQKIHS